MVGTTCSYSCTNGDPRTTQCYLNKKSATWSQTDPCPPFTLDPNIGCGDLAFDTGAGSTTVCLAAASGSTCSFDCLSGDARSILCKDGSWGAVDKCPAAVECGPNNPLFLASQALNTVAGTPGVSQDRPDSGRFRVEWQADTPPVPVIPGTLAASRQGAGQFELMAECCLDQAPTLAELPIQFVSGSATFQYNKDTLNWDFGPLFNPIYLTPPDSEPGIVIASNAEETAILQLIWVEKFVPAEGAPGPVRVRVQAEDAAAFPRGWPENTPISVSATFNIKVAGSDTIYTYTTESGSFDYGDVQGAAQTTLVAGAAIGMAGLVGAAFMIRKRLRTQNDSSLQDKEEMPVGENSDIEELPDLEKADFSTVTWVEDAEESDFITTKT